MALALGGIALISTLILSPLMRRMAYRCRFMLDIPSNARQIHQKPIPRIGGVGMAGALVLAVFAGMLFSNKGYLSRPVLGILAAGVLGLHLGIYDDIYGLKAYKKLSGQAAIGLVLIASGLRVERMVFPFFWDVSLPRTASLLATLFWVTATMNAVNLIDGMDGLAGGLLLIASLGLLFLADGTGNTLAALMAAGIVGICLGFLPYNFHPASIFMGDCGSMFLGATFAGLSLLLTRNGTTTGSLWIPITFLTIPFLDMTLAIIRRMHYRQGPLTADREHLHHRLLNWGLSQRQAALVFYSLGVLMGGLAITCFHWTDAGAMSVIAVVGLVLLVDGVVMNASVAEGRLIDAVSVHKPVDKHLVKCGRVLH